MRRGIKRSCFSLFFGMFSLLLGLLLCLVPAGAKAVLAESTPSFSINLLGSGSGNVSYSMSIEGYVNYEWDGMSYIPVERTSTKIELNIYPNGDSYVSHVEVFGRRLQPGNYYHPYNEVIWDIYNNPNSYLDPLGGGTLYIDSNGEELLFEEIRISFDSIVTYTASMTGEGTVDIFSFSYGNNFAYLSSNEPEVEFTVPPDSIDFAMKIYPAEGYFVKSVMINGGEDLSYMLDREPANRMKGFDTSQYGDILWFNMDYFGEHTINIEFAPCHVVEVRTTGNVDLPGGLLSGYFYEPGEIFEFNYDSYTLFYCLSNSNLIIPVNNLPNGTNEYGDDIIQFLVNGEPYTQWRYGADLVLSGINTDYMIDIEFYFAPRKIIASAGSGGSISDPGETFYDYGSYITYVFTPDTGYSVSGISINGVYDPYASNSYSFNWLVEDQTIEVFFEPANYTVTASKTGNGTVSPTTQYIQHGQDSQTIFFAASANNYIANIFINGLPQAGETLQNLIADGFYTFTNVTYNNYIHVEFAATVYSITASAGANGTITPSANVTHGGSKTFFFTPNEGYRVGIIRVDGVALTGPEFSAAVNTGYTFLNVTETHTISVTFEVRTYTIFSSSGPDGTISPYGNTTVGYNQASETFIFTPADGFQVENVYIDGVALNESALALAIENGYTFTGVKKDYTISVTFTGFTYRVTATSEGNGTVWPDLKFVTHKGDHTVTFSADQYNHIQSISINGVFQTGTVLQDLIAAGSYTFTDVMSHQSIHVVFETDLYIITSSVSPNGAGTITASASVPHGEDKTFIFSPNTGYLVTGITVDNLPLSGTILTDVIYSGRYTFYDVTQPHTISVFFAVRTYGITASATAGGTITPEGTITVDHGDSQLFTFKPNDGYHISAISINGTNQTGENLQNLILSGKYEFNNVIANRSIVVSFAINDYTITVTKGGNGNGTVSPVGEMIVEYGDRVVVTFTVAQYSHIQSITIDGTALNSDELADCIDAGEYIFESIENSRTFLIVIAIDQYPITASAGDNGTITSSASVDHGSNRNFRFYPSTGFNVAVITVDGRILEGSEFTNAVTSGYTFYSVTGPHTISVEFTIKVYTIISSSETGGTITPEGLIEKVYGSSQTYNFLPEPGFHVESVTINGTPLQGDDLTEAITNNRYIFDNIIRNQTIVVTFTGNIYTLTATAFGGGIISPSSTVNVGYHAEQTFIFTPSEGYKISGLVIDGYVVTGEEFTSAVESGSFTFSDISSNHTISVTFSSKEITYIITSSTTGNGTITPTAIVEKGSSKTFTFTSAKGYHVETIRVDGDLLEDTALTNYAENGYTFTNVNDNHYISVTFTKNILTVTSVIWGVGTVDQTKTVPYEENITFAFSPGQHYRVASIVIDGVALTDTVFEDAVREGKYSFVKVTSDRTILVVFEVITYTISASAGDHGNITTSATIAEGGFHTFHFFPDVGYRVATILVDGTPLESTDFIRAVAEGYAFTDISGPHTISVTFVAQTYTIFTSASGNGTITETTDADYGEDIVIFFTPLANFFVSSVFVDGMLLTGAEFDQTVQNGFYEFKNVNKNHTIAVTFETSAENMFTIIAFSGEDNGIIQGNSTVERGGNETFTFSPNPGYYISGIVIDGVPLIAEELENAINNGYTFSNVRKNHALFVQYSIYEYSIVLTKFVNNIAGIPKQEKVSYGSQKTLSYSLEAGETLTRISVDGIDLTAEELAAFIENGYTFSDITQNHAVEIFVQSSDGTSGELLAWQPYLIGGSICGAVGFLVACSLYFIRRKPKK